MPDDLVATGYIQSLLYHCTKEITLVLHYISTAAPLGIDDEC